MDSHFGAITAFDRWIRSGFRELNTRLEEAYFAAGVEIVRGRPELDALAAALLRDGARLTRAIADDGRLPSDPDERYELLGVVGYFVAACRRHEIDGSDAALGPAWSVATRLGASLGVAPRYVFAHQALFNTAVDGRYRTFTSLPDERAFIDNNGLGVLAYQRAAAALRAIPAMGVSNPLAGQLLDDARAALADVLRFNQELSRRVDVTRFFLNIRPYFKPHRVGDVEYRGVNAGDFAAVNEIDLALGLCDASDPFYQGLLAEKQPFVPPGDQVLLRAAVTRRPLLDRFLAEAAGGEVSAELRGNAERFLAVCRAHGAAYAFHHHKLVKPYLERPARAAPPDRHDGMTASGPPLDAVLATLERLRNLRAARDHGGVVTAERRLAELRRLIAPRAGARRLEAAG